MYKNERKMRTMKAGYVLREGLKFYLLGLMSDEEI